MKDKILRFLDFAIYWSIVIMPFSVAVAPGIANTFIGLFSVSFIIKKSITRQAFSTDRLTLVSFGLFFAASAISIMNSVSYGASFGGIIKLLKYILIFLVCSEEVRDKKHITRIIIAICSGVCLAAIDALWQMVFGYDFIHRIAIQAAIGLPRPTAAFPNPNVFGIYMTALTPLIFGLTFFYFKGRNKILMFFASVLGLLGVYLSLSRGAGLGIFLAILFLSIANKKKLLTSILVGILIAFPFVMPKNIKQWAKEVNYNPLVMMCNRDRISIYNNTINMIKHHPFIGVGLNTFSRNYGKYKTEQAEKYAHTADTIYAHNIYLQMAGEVGLLGLAMFLLFLFQVFRQAFNALRKLNDEYLKIIGLSLVACVIAFLVNGLTETSLYYPRVAMVFWYIIGISLALNKFVDGQKT
ncbi:MAG: O-antigen ligase family protein [Candidatus Omnitrophica bacterium]|nr:O-antigen ligase family protein [Candidatus Omnitrophota bacterium]